MITNVKKPDHSLRFTIYILGSSTATRFLISRIDDLFHWRFFSYVGLNPVRALT